MCTICAHSGAVVALLRSIRRKHQQENPRHLIVLSLIVVWSPHIHPFDREGGPQPSIAERVKGKTLLTLSNPCDPKQPVPKLQEKTIERSVAVSSHIPCRVGHVIAPLHSLASSFAILINRVAPPNMLPTHLATTLPALARRMSSGSSCSALSWCPLQELIAEATPLRLITLSCFLPSSAFIAI